MSVRESFNLTVRIYDVRQVGEHVGISVSFPTLLESGGSTGRYSSGSADVEVLEYTSSLSNVAFHQPGATIYHKENNRQFPAEYLLVESDDQSWSRSDDRTLELRGNAKARGRVPHPDTGMAVRAGIHGLRPESSLWAGERPAGLAGNPGVHHR